MCMKCRDGTCNRRDKHLWLKKLFLVAVLKDIVLIPVHTKPWDSEKELDELYDVVFFVEVGTVCRLVKRDVVSWFPVILHSK